VLITCPLLNRGYQMVRFFVICLIAIVLTIGSVSVVASKTPDPGKTNIIVGGEIGYPPYSFLDKNGEPTGFSIELTQAIAKIMGINVEIRLRPWPETRKALENGTIDIIPGMFYSEERAKLFDFSPPFAIVSTAIFARKNSPAVKSIKDIRNKEIIVMRGEVMHDYILKHSLTDRILLTETPADALRLLASGKGDYALVAQMPGFYWIKELKLSNIISVGPSLEPFKNCFAVRKGNKLLLSRFIEGLSIINQTGEYSKLYEKWLGVLAPTGIAFGLAVKYVAIVVVPLILLLAFSLVWSWMLRSRVNQKTSELQKSEERYRTLVENASDIIFGTDNTGHFNFVNPAALRITGYKEEELIGMHYPELIRPDMHDEAIKFFGRQFVKGLNNTYSEYPIIKKDGHELWLGQNTQLIVEDGNITGFQSVARDITERKRVEQELRKSEERFRYILENAQVAIWSADLSGQFDFLSPIMASIYGRPLSEMMANPDFWIEAVHPEDQSSARASNDALRLDHQIELEYRIVHADGTIRWISDRKTILRDEHGAPSHLAGIITEITNRKQAEELLRQSEEQYRLLFESAGEGILLAQGDMIKFANTALEEILGYPRDIITTKTFSSFIHPDDRAMVFDRHMRRMRGETIETGYRFRIISADGTVRWLHITSQVISWEGIPASLSFVMDITDHKRAEDELRESEERYRNLFENAQEAIFVIQDAKVVFLNPIAAPQLGYSDEDFLSKSFLEFIHPDDQNMVIDNHIRRLKGEKFPNIYSFRLIHKDGSVRWGELNAVSINWKGKPAVMNFLKDITDRKKAEDDLKISEINLRMILDSVDNAIFIYTKTGKIIDVNSKMLEMYRVSREEVCSMSIEEDFSTPENPLSELPGIWESVIKGEERIFEWQARRPHDGSTFNVEVFLRKINLNNGEFILATVRDITERKRVEKQLHNTLESLRKSVGTTIQVMVSAVESRDPYTAGHQVRSANLASAIATEMGLSQDRIESIRLAGSIHDIGKLSIPAEILSKPTKLSELEFSLIKTHARQGYEMLKNVESPWPLAEIVYQHHEQIDGSGYPRKLKGNDILIEARILNLADVVEAMASHRPYRPAKGIKEALEEIEKNSGILYDKSVVDACLRLFREKGYQLDVT